jgi:tripartite-type tricarboxylate transporter receptor subunit TctC
MRLTTLNRIAAALLGLAAFASTAVAQTAEQWPNKPVRIFIPVGPGGVADTLARTLANAFQPHANGHGLVVENRPGAGGTIAAAAVVREAPDGYNLFLADVGPNAVSHTMAKLTYDPHTAFTPIIHLANLPAILVVAPDLPHKTLADFIAAAKAAPNKYNFTSAGLGNWTHLFMTHMNMRAGIEQVSLVTRSGPEMAMAVMRGDAHTAILSVSTSLPLIKDGKLRAMAGVGARPMPLLPDVPAIAKDLPGFDAAIWHGIVGPAGMDAALTKRINAVFNAVLKDPAVIKVLNESMAADIVGGTPEQFDTFVKGELQRWPVVMKALGAEVK